MVWSALILVIKKALTHPKANQEARTSFTQKISEYEKESREIVYLDESGFAHDMPELMVMHQSINAVSALMTGRPKAGLMWLELYVAVGWLRSVCCREQLTAKCFSNGLNRIYWNICQNDPWSSWIMQRFTSERIRWPYWKKHSIRLSFYRLTRLTLIRSKRNGRRQKLVGESTGAR